jgi:hypothetical protein
MLGAVLIFFLTTLLAFYAISILKNRYAFLDDGFLKRLYFYHTFLAIVYFLYTLFNRSDSRHYYLKVINGFRGNDLFDYYGTSTPFIEFLAFPFIKYLGFSYEATMVLFSFIGYLGFVYLYVFFRENIKFEHDFLGINMLTLFFYLPNLHFWSGSLGKGSVIFFGIGLFFFALNNIKSRWIFLLLGGFIIYHVRPHVMMVILVSSTIGFVFSTKGISMALRITFLAFASIAFFYIYNDVLHLVGIENDEVLSEGLDLSHRARELSKATSGIDISSYSLPEQLFAFLYRPLFFDAPGILGLIVSVENVFYLMMTIRLFSLKGLRFIITGNFLIKSAFFSFLTVSIALAQISGNLGLAIRQKSQVMILFLFVIISFLDDQKIKQRRIQQQNKLRMSRISAARKTTE